MSPCQAFELCGSSCKLDKIFKPPWRCCPAELLSPWRLSKNVKSTQQIKISSKDLSFAVDMYLLRPVRNLPYCFRLHLYWLLPGLYSMLPLKASCNDASAQPYGAQQALLDWSEVKDYPINLRHEYWSWAWCSCEKKQNIAVLHYRREL